MNKACFLYRLPQKRYFLGGLQTFKPNPMQLFHLRLISPQKFPFPTPINIPPFWECPEIRLPNLLSYQNLQPKRLHPPRPRKGH